MDSLIIDNREPKYRVMDAEGNILRENVARSIAIRFIESLGEAQSGVYMVPITDTGDQILFG